MQDKKVVNEIKSLIFRYDEKSINKKLFESYVESVHKTKKKPLEIGLITIT